jgi:hypothetical protein
MHDSFPIIKIQMLNLKDNVMFPVLAIILTVGTAQLVSQVFPLQK